MRTSGHHVVEEKEVPALAGVGTRTWLDRKRFRVIRILG
jgi:hypothetical protein